MFAECCVLCEVQLAGVRDCGGLLIGVGSAHVWLNNFVLCEGWVGERKLISCKLGLSCWLNIPHYLGRMFAIQYQYIFRSNQTGMIFVTRACH